MKKELSSNDNDSELDIRVIMYGFDPPTHWVTIIAQSAAKGTGNPDATGLLYSVRKVTSRGCISITLSSSIVCTRFSLGHPYFWEC